MEQDIDGVIARLHAVLDQGPELRLAFLFGSVVSGRIRADSDIDVAILPRDPHLALSEELELQRRLTLACGRTVDLVRLDHASTLLRWEVACHGVVLAAKPGVERARFLARAASEHADLAPALAEAAGRYRRNLIQGQGKVKR